MESFKDDFKKSGGVKKIADFAREGVLGTVCGEILLLGRSHKALEIANLSAQFKIYNKLEKRYKKYIKTNTETNVAELSNKTVWLCWLQGIEKAPELVKRCYKSVEDNFPNWNVVVITEDNLLNYTDFPTYIIEKWKKGIITNTHFSDLLRVELLTRHGGLWLDATVYCTSCLPKYIENTDLFFYQVLKPGFTGHVNRVSSWLIWARPNNFILNETKSLLWRYWKIENELFDYFLFHYFLTMVLNSNEEMLNRIIPSSNEAPHVLLLRLFDQYDEQLWQAIKIQTPFHKLSYKFDKDKENLAGTYYDVVIRKEK